MARHLIKRLMMTTALTVIGFAGNAAYAQTKVDPVQVSVGGFFGQFVSYISQDDVAARANGSSGKVTQFDESADSRSISTGG